MTLYLHLKRELHFDEKHEVKSFFQIQQARIIQCFFIGLILISNVARATDNKVDVVLDMDNTLIRTFRQPEIKPAKFLMPHTDPEDYVYRILDGTPEFLQAMSETPNIRISIFSMGHRRRNLALLNELKLPNGKKAIDVIYRVLSGEDGTLVDGAEMKDLTKINPDLRRVLMVEDTKDSVLLSQRGHVLWIGDKPKDFPNALKDTLIIDGADFTDNISRFVQYRNRLAYALGSIQKVIETANEPNFSIEDSLTKLQWIKNPEGHRVFKESIQPDLQLQRAGVREFHRVNPEYHYTSAIPGITPIQCIHQTLNLIR